MNQNEEIKSRLPIEQVVGAYVPLKKAGRIYKAPCPFHNEKTPSFTVSPDRGMFKCFGCGEGGDIFDFVMKIEGLTFPEALKLLAEQAGVKLEEPEYKGKSGGPEETSKPRLISLNTYAAKLWHTILAQHPKAQTARDYLKRRGLTDETIVTFQIGYAPLGQATVVGLKQAGYTPAELRAAGDPGKFQDRITFPISDMTGRVVGFTGRLLEAPDDPRGGESRGPKYWNTPEDSVFIKSRTLYALHLAKKAIQEEETVILAEGQMDVAVLHQSGFANSVASSGTALTQEQVKLLGRFTPNISFAYDNDNAGIKATKRGIEIVMAEDLNPFVITNPAGKDPADALLQDKESWEQAYANRQPALAWLIDQSFKEHPGATPLDKKNIVQEILPWLTKVTNEVERSEWIRVLAGRLRTDEENIRTALTRTSKTVSVRPAGTDTPPTPSKQGNGRMNPAELAAAMVIAYPAILPTIKDQLDSLKKAEQTPFLQTAVPIFESTDHLEETLQSLPDDERKELLLKAEELMLPYAEVETNELWALEEFVIIARRLRSEAKEEAKSQLAEEIRAAQQENNTAKLQELLGRLKELL